jgi:hypothetical protein
MREAEREKQKGIFVSIEKRRVVAVVGKMSRRRERSAYLGRERERATENQQARGISDIYPFGREKSINSKRYFSPKLSFFPLSHLQSSFLFLPLCTWVEVDDIAEFFVDDAM